MRRNVGPALLIGCIVGLPAGAALSPRVVAYRIHADLDPQKKIVTGRETLTWTNDSPDAVGELQFHLYLNAFQNEKSTFMRESGGQLRGDRATKGSWGWIDLQRLQIEGGADLLSAIRYIHPEDDNADDAHRASMKPLTKKDTSVDDPRSAHVHMASRRPTSAGRTG